jgi:homoserine O-acetyltransferase
LTKAADLFDLGETHGSLEQAISRIRCAVLAIGIDTDYLFPVEEQQEIAEAIAMSGGNAQLEIIVSENGHDGIFIEFEQLNRILQAFFEKNTNGK